MLQSLGKEIGTLVIQSYRNDVQLVSFLTGAAQLPLHCTMSQATSIDYRGIYRCSSLLSRLYKWFSGAADTTSLL